MFILNYPPGTRIFLWALLKLRYDFSSSSSPLYSPSLSFPLTLTGCSVFSILKNLNIFWRSYPSADDPAVLIRFAFGRPSLLSRTIVNPHSPAHVFPFSVGLLGCFFSRPKRILFPTTRIVENFQKHESHKRMRVPPVCSRSITNRPRFSDVRTIFKCAIWGRKKIKSSLKLHRDFALTVMPFGYI